jgi:hypothetical protein
MKTQRLPGVAKAGGLDERKPNPKERVVHKLKQFVAIFLYLWVLLALFDLHRTIILAEHHLNYPAQGFAIVNALVMAKVILIAEALHLGSRFRDKPLIYSILYKSFAFSVALIGFHIFERLLVGVLSGRTIAQSFPAMGGGSLKEIVSIGTIVFVALIPFFAFREVSRVIGPRELWSLLLTRGTNVYTLQSSPQRSEGG